MINTTYKPLATRDIRLHPGVQFLIFTGMFLGLLFIGNLIGLGIAGGLYGFDTVMDIASAKFTSPHSITALWILQIAGTTLPIFIAPVLFSCFIVRYPAGYLKTSFKFPFGLLFIILLVMLLSNPVIELLSNINQHLHLSGPLSGVQRWIESSEKAAQQITDYILHMSTIWNMILDVLLIGLLTAIVEEFMFRGVLQTIFVRWTKNTHVAIWITAILFSAFHMEFFGFLPRLMLGVLFGYFVVWSGSIWTSVWAHFLNNGTAVVATYLSRHKLIKLDPNDQHVFNYTAYMISAVILVMLLLIYRRLAVGVEQLPEE